MIATLSGKVAEKLAERIVLDVQGVGYGLLVSSEDFGSLKIGEPAKLYIYEHIREDSHELFGFTNNDTKFFFEQLLSVNGVGPKMALNLLSIGNLSEVRKAIAGGDLKFIQAANGVGRKVAERIVIELKDKVGLVSSAEGILVGNRSADQDEAVQALVSLGYSTADAVQALQSVDTELPSEQRVKLALKDGN